MQDILFIFRYPDYLKRQEAVNVEKLYRVDKKTINKMENTILSKLALNEMESNEMELIFGGCGWCSVVDAAAAAAKGLIHALK